MITDEPGQIANLEQDLVWNVPDMVVDPTSSRVGEDDRGRGDPGDVVHDVHGDVMMMVVVVVCDT